MPVGDVDQRFGAQLAQQQDQKRAAGRAVDIVIAEDGDTLAARHRRRQPLGGLVHVAEQAGIGQQVAQRRVAISVEFVRGDPAAEQQLVDQVGPELLFRLRPPPAPSLARQRLFHPKRHIHGCADSSSERMVRA